MLKPGFKTTEFWMALIGPLVAILVLVGVVTPEEGETLEVAIVNGVVALLALYAAVKPILEYIRSRTQVKEALAEASAVSGRVESLRL